MVIVCSKIEIMCNVYKCSSTTQETVRVGKNKEWDYFTGSPTVSLSHFKPN